MLSSMLDVLICSQGKVINSSDAPGTAHKAPATDSRQGGSVHSAAPEPVQNFHERNDADVRTKSRVQVDAKRQIVKPLDVASVSANSRVSMFRVAQESFGSSAESVVSYQRSPQSSFEGQDPGCSSARVSNGSGPAPLIAMYHPGGRANPLSAVPQDGGAHPALLQAPAGSLLPPPDCSSIRPAADPSKRQPGAADAGGAPGPLPSDAEASAPDDWRQAVPEPRGAFPGSPILPTDNSRCDAIVKCAPCSRRPL